MVFKINSLFKQLQKVQIASTDINQEYMAISYLSQYSHHINDSSYSKKDYGNLLEKLAC